jgi:hypothetical protein
MSYNERRGPNVSEYVANLNAIPSAQDLQSSSENYNLDEELAMFTNTQFFDFDAGQDSDLHLGPFASSDEPSTAAATAPEKETAAPMDFLQGALAISVFCSVVTLLLLRCRSTLSCSAGTSISDRHTETTDAPHPLPSHHLSQTGPPRLHMGERRGGEGDPDTNMHSTSTTSA